MTTFVLCLCFDDGLVVEAYRLGKYDNFSSLSVSVRTCVVEAYGLGKYDNLRVHNHCVSVAVVEAYRLGKYDNFTLSPRLLHLSCCRSLSFG